MTLHAKHKFDKAMADINQAIKLNPNYSKAFYDRGIVNYDRQAFDRTVAAAQVAEKPAYIANFGDRGTSYGNRREGDRIIQDPHQAIKNNHYNAFAYSPAPEAPLAPVVVTAKTRMLVSPEPSAKEEIKEKPPVAKKQAATEPPTLADKHPVSKPGDAAQSPRSAPKATASIPIESVRLPQPRPRPVQHNARR
jgi:hypothetical protein